MKNIALYAGGAVLAWWLADHISIDQGGTGLSFPLRTKADDDKAKQNELEEKLKVPILGQGRGGAF